MKDLTDKRVDCIMSYLKKTRNDWYPLQTGTHVHRLKGEELTHFDIVHSAYSSFLSFILFRSILPSGLTHNY